MKKTASLLCILGLIVAACQAGSSNSLSPAAATSTSLAPGNAQTTPSLTITVPADPDIQALIEKSKEDLAQRFGVSVDGITVTAVIGQEFSTDAFYCKTFKERIAREESPQVVSGHSILLSLSGRQYEYHVSGQAVIFCRPLP